MIDKLDRKNLELQEKFKESLNNKPHCHIDDKINSYQRFMDQSERARHPMQNAYCLVEDYGCPFHVMIMGNNYCRYDCKDGKVLK